jgi:SWIM zinc finger
MLTLSNFEKHINDTVLKRGKNYYEQGMVVELEESADNLWQAEVTGSDTYAVEIAILNNKKKIIDDYSCTCPFEGIICKHVVAVLLAIKEEIKNASPGSPAANKKIIFEDLVKKTGLKELQQFIAAYALKNKDFKTAFELHFANKDERIDISKKYTELIRKVIRKYADHGFVDYRSTFNLSREIDEIVNTGLGFVKKKNFKDAFLLAKPALKEMMEVIAACDDSAGNIGSTISSIVQLIEAIADADDAANELKEQVFSFLQTELSNTLYFDYGDFGYELFGIFQNLAVAIGKPDQFLKFIDDRIVNLKGAYTDYRINFYRTQKIYFLKAMGNSKEADKLIHQNLDIVEVRLGEVNNAINRKDFAKAKALIADGIKIAEKKEHPGTVSNWQKELLRIAELEKDIKTVRYYSKLFAFDRWFNESYYQQWKQTFSATEWKDVLEQHIAETFAAVTNEYERNKKKMWNPPGNPPVLREIAPIYIREKFWDRLLVLVQKEADMDIILEYHKHLFKEYPRELIEIYLPAFERKADRCNSRSEYKELAGIMKMVIKDIPVAKSKIIALAKKLMQKYPRRPAMIEELDKIN